jgi:hypothetical protein
MHVWSDNHAVISLHVTIALLLAIDRQSLHYLSSLPSHPSHRHAYRHPCARRRSGRWQPIDNSSLALAGCTVRCPRTSGCAGVKSTVNTCCILVSFTSRRPSQDSHGARESSCKATLTLQRASCLLWVAHTIPQCLLKPTGAFFFNCFFSFSGVGSVPVQLAG